MTQTGTGSVYSAGISGKGALLDETLIVLRHLAQGLSIDQVRAGVIERDLLGKMTHSTRESVWDRIHARYLSDEPQAHVLAQMVVHAPDRQTESLVLFYEFCRSTPLLHDLTIDCVYPRYVAGYSGIDKSVLQQHLDAISPTHPELAAWSPQTRDKVVSNVLTILRDLGLLRGAQRKTFHRVYVPLPAFVYVLYRLAGDGLTAPGSILASNEWKLFFLERADVTVLLDEATAAGHCTFKHQGDLSTLDLRYSSLEACVEVLTSQV
ncbi:MAG: DUF1819 family protein [Anaerolineae bacterium]|nr:DUF1819 family protein [Anaerolineae bacterium]